jgi:hypothetical protein
LNIVKGNPLEEGFLAYSLLSSEQMNCLLTVDKGELLQVLLIITLEEVSPLSGLVELRRGQLVSSKTEI